MKYEYKGKTYGNASDVISAVTDDISDIDEYQQDWIDYMDDMTGTVEICGLEYWQGTALHDIDPIAFHEACQQEMGALMTDLRYEIERLEDGSRICVVIGSGIITAHEDDEE
ncbi:MAG: hypothetical protein WCS21_07795 [Lachnospiraceae bacterium]